MRECSSCQAVNDDKAQFCLECGQKLAPAGRPGPGQDQHDQQNPNQQGGGRQRLHSPILGGYEEIDDSPRRSPEKPRPAAPKGKPAHLRSPLLGGSDDDDEVFDDSQMKPGKQKGQMGKPGGKMRSPLLGGAGGDTQDDYEEDFPLRDRHDDRSPFPHRTRPREADPEMGHAPHQPPQQPPHPANQQGSKAHLRSPLLGGSDDDYVEDQYQQQPNARNAGGGNPRPQKLHSPIFDRQSSSGGGYDDYDDDDGQEIDDPSVLRSPLLAAKSRVPLDRSPKPQQQPQQQDQGRQAPNQQQSYNQMPPAGAPQNYAQGNPNAAPQGYPPNMPGNQPQPGYGQQQNLNPNANPNANPSIGNQQPGYAPPNQAQTGYPPQPAPSPPQQPQLVQPQSQAPFNSAPLNPPVQPGLAPPIGALSAQNPFQQPAPAQPTAPQAPPAPAQDLHYEFGMPGSAAGLSGASTPNSLFLTPPAPAAQPSFAEPQRSLLLPTDVGPGTTSGAAPLLPGFPNPSSESVLRKDMSATIQESAVDVTLIEGAVAGASTKSLPSKSKLKGGRFGTPPVDPDEDFDDEPKAPVGRKGSSSLPPRDSSPSVSRGRFDSGTSSSSDDQHYDSAHSSPGSNAPPSPIMPVFIPAFLAAIAKLWYIVTFIKALQAQLPWLVDEIAQLALFVGLIIFAMKGTRR